MEQATFPLLSTNWLAEHLEQADLVILESTIFMERGTAASPTSRFRSGVAEFNAEGRIPGARFADLFMQFSDPDASLPFTRPNGAQFRAAAGYLGVKADSTVVIYDRLAGQWAARLWWIFRSFGHANVYVLNGGFKKYKKEQHVIETGPHSPSTEVDYGASGPEDFVAFRNDVTRVMAGQHSGSLICLLKPDDYSGAISVRSRAGHIPTSVNLPFTDLLDDNDNTIRAADELRAAFSSVVPLDGRLIVTYCGGGIASTLGALALAAIGYTNTLEYDGSLVDWITDPQAPMELG